VTDHKSWIGDAVCDCRAKRVGERLQDKKVAERDAKRAAKAIPPDQNATHVCLQRHP
jgi:hypothetical protein